MNLVNYYEKLSGIGNKYACLLWNENSKIRPAHLRHSVALFDEMHLSNRLSLR